MLTLSMLAVFTPCIASATTYGTYGDFSYKTDGSNITIWNYEGDNSDVVIPAEIDGLPVTSIGGFTFYECYSLTNVTIPGSVTFISADVFAGCDSLTDIYYGGSEEQWNPVIIYPYFDYSYLDRVNMHYSGVSSAQPTTAPTAAPTAAPAQPTAAPEQIAPAQPTAAPTAAPQTGSFSDVPSNYWAYNNIKRITELGGFKGYEDGTFKPENQITHEEFLKVVISLMYKGDANAAPASALGASWEDWAKPMLNAAVDAGIVKADDSDILAANTPITRAEMAQIISRTLDYLGKTKAASPDTSKITDWNYVAEAYRPYVEQVYAKGIITGYDDGSFGPAMSLTRSEASAVIARMIDAN